ncbi:hypothetical protein PG985_002558 [Apiospora marii]|uniref:Uncharacterized protein n=1 Tax=Apiospora marii TaxID=335849 RepID=A0ABR1RTM2_9PEZI
MHIKDKCVNVLLGTALEPKLNPESSPLFGLSISDTMTDLTGVLAIGLTSFITVVGSYMASGANLGIT